MIQLDEKDKQAMMNDPPAYSTETTLYPPPQSQQSPFATGSHPPSSYASSPPAHSPQGYPPSPATGVPFVQQLQPQPQLTPAQMEAQVGSQYQQQLFARCARGDHDMTTKYGPCGIITAVLLFPFGLICLFMDTEKKCTRCGVIEHS